MSLAATIGAQYAMAAENGDFSDFGDLDLAALLDAPVESASGKTEIISLAPAIIEVITPEQIRAWGASDIYEAIAHIAGVEIVDTYFGWTVVYMRGLQSAIFNSKVLFLIDNMPIYEIGTMASHLEIVPITAVKRIEVIRGPAGVLFGTNAYAGVIHVFTKDPTQSNANASVAAGAMASSKNRDAVPPNGGRNKQAGTGDGRGSGAYVWDRGYVQADIQVKQSPNWTAIIPETQSTNGAPPPYVRHEFPKYQTNATGLIKLQQRVGDQNFTALGGFSYQKKSKWGIQPAADVEPLPNDARTSFASLYWRRSFDRLSLDARTGWNRNVEISPIGIVTVLAQFRPNDPLRIEVDTQKFDGAFSLGYATENRKLSVDGGIQGGVFVARQYRLIFTSDDSLAPGVPEVDPDSKTYEINLFSQVKLQPIERLSLVAGLRGNFFDPGQLRRDQSDPKGRFTPNPRAAVIYRLHERLTAKMLYGRAFRVPSLWELFVEAASFIKGEPTLVPETLDTIEIAFDSRPLDALSVRVNGFVNISNSDIQLIDLGSGFGQGYINAPGSIISGVETSLRYVWTTWLDTQAALGFQEGHQRQTGNYMSEIPRLIGVMSATGTLVDRKLALTPSIRVTGKRDDLKASAIVNATAYYNVNPYFGMGLIAKNVFDAAHADVENSNRQSPGGIVQNQPRTLSAYIEGRF